MIQSLSARPIVSVRKGCGIRSIQKPLDRDKDDPEEAGSCAPMGQGSIPAPVATPPPPPSTEPASPLDFTRRDWEISTRTGNWAKRHGIAQKTWRPADLRSMRR